MKREFYKNYTRVSKTKAKTAFKNNKAVIYWNETKLINNSTPPNYVESEEVFTTPKLKYFIVVD